MPNSYNFNINAKRVKYFVAVAESKHFGRAAELLHMAQPPLSQQIRLLEKELGINLFVRTTRHVELTEAGSALFQNAKRALEDLKQAVLHARLVQQGKAGLFRLGFVTTIALNLLPQVLKRFRQAFPEATIECSHMTSQEQQQALVERRLDAGFVRLHRVDPQLACFTIHREKLFLAVSAQHRLARERSVRPAALAGEPFIMWDQRQSAGIAAIVTGLCQAHGFEPKIALEVRDVHALLSLVTGGLGIAIVPESAINLKQRGLVYRPIRDTNARSDVVLVWHKNDQRPLLKRFIAVATEFRPLGRRL